jgi:FlaA1/EpsC-like NDP-sugar epimerase
MRRLKPHPYVRYALDALSPLRQPRLLLVVGAHALLFVAIYIVAFLLRFDFALTASQGSIIGATLPWFLATKLLIFYGSRYFQHWSRHVTFADLVSLLTAALVSLLCLAGINHFFTQYYIPRAVLLLDFCGTILGLGALRSVWRLVDEHARPLLRQPTKKRALLIGAGRSDKIFAQRLQAYAHFPYRICGFLDDDASRRGETVGGIPVLGGISDLRLTARRHAVTDVFVVSGSLPGNTLRTVMDECEARELNLQIIPPLAQIFQGDNRIPLKPLDIADLLRREPVDLDLAALQSLFTNTTVFVTGAGGSIGSEICRQLLDLPLKQLVLVERSEGNLFNIDTELRRRNPRCEVVPALGDVTDSLRMRALFERYSPHVILHAAAHKHVPMLEAHPGEAVKNNVFGTALMADLADEFNAGTFVLVSTDKAVNPSSIMGVTKHLAEEYVHAMSANSDTRFIVVRFGNVLGSSGSVVPLFQEQIRRGGPITVTHPEMKRFFMAISEASQLVLQAAAMGHGGEIFVLEMGDQVRIVDLARDLVRLSGLPPHAIEIVYSGVRPGEKLYEELYFSDEEHQPTSHPKVRAALHRPIQMEELRETLEDLRILMDGDAGPLLQRLKDSVVEYVGSPLSTGPHADEGRHRVRGERAPGLATLPERDVGVRVH